MEKYGYECREWCVRGLLTKCTKLMLMRVNQGVLYLEGVGDTPLHEPVYTNTFLDLLIAE